MALDEECAGFLADLANRPDVIANVRVLKLEELLIPKPKPIYGIFPVFRVRRVDDPSSDGYTYQYFSWCQGPLSGAKGILLVEGAHGEITHLIVNQGEKFATGGVTYDGFGGFAEVSEDSIASMITRFHKEILEELGLKEIIIKDIVDLGRLRVDAGMTNNYPKIFAAIIDGTQAAKIDEGMKQNADKRELQMETVLVPIERLPEFTFANDDAFFLSCIYRFAVRRGLRKIGWDPLLS
jgi:hypothetical protein